MRICRYILIIISVFIHYNTIKAQSDFRKGFIITNDGNTISGFIDFINPKISSEHCYFKKDSVDQITDYTTADLKEYGIYGYKHYVKKEITVNEEKKFVFLEYLVDGTVDLYIYFSIDGIFYYIEKNNVLLPLTNEEKEFYTSDGRRMMKNNKKYLGTLNSIMGDGGEWTQKINGTELNHRSLINLTIDYNKKVCKDENCINYFKKQDKLNETKYMVKFGFNIEHINSKFDLKINIPINEHLITNTNVTSSSSASAFSPGLLINIKRGGRLSFQMEMKYLPLKFEGVNFQILRVPLNLIYDFMHHTKFTPYVKMGIYSNYYLNVDFNQTMYADYHKITSYKLDSASHTYTPATYDFFHATFYENNIIYKKNSGYNFGFGLKYIERKYMINLDINKTYSRQLKKDFSKFKITSQMQDWSLSLGYSYIF